MTHEVPCSTPSPAAIPVTLLPIKDPQLRVFHVNDSTDDQILFQAACHKANVPFNWHVADSADKGISYLKTLVAQSQAVPVCWPDLIVLDVHMPFENGFEVLKFIRATPQLKRLPVVIFTGDTFPETREQSIALGANLFLLKPVNFQEIVELARSLYELMRQMKSEYSPPTSPSQ